MDGVKKAWPIAGGRQATGGALRSRQTYQTNVSIILSDDADAKGCVAFFMHSPYAPCEGISSCRTYALAALYVAELLSDHGKKFPYSFEMLTVVLCSMLRVRRSTAIAIIAALEKAGMLIEVRTTSWGGVANE